MIHVKKFSEVAGIKDKVRVFVVLGGFDVYQRGDEIPVVPSDPYFPILDAVQIRLALDAAGLLSEAEQAVSVADPATQIWWRESKTFSRYHPILVQMIAALGWTESQVDALWHQAATL